MEVIIGVILLVAGVSLYEYFSGRKWQQLTSVERNEMVFENRNKKYGAYVLRRDYDKSMVYIMGGLLLVFGLGFGTFIYARSLPDEVVTLPKTEYVETIETSKTDEEIIEQPKPEKTEPVLRQETAFRELIASDVDSNDEPPVDGTLDDKNIGNTNQTGEEIDWTMPEDKDPVDKIIERIDVDPIEPFVDEEPIFKGSINEYIVSKLVYPEMAIQREAQGKCYLKFVVNTDGSVSNVSIIRGVPDCEECDAEAVRVIKAMPAWKPAKHNGRVVRSWMTIPIQFTLE